MRGATGSDDCEHAPTGTATRAPIMTADECATPTKPANADVAVHRDYEHNQARFTEFYAVQKVFVGCVARLPALVRTWLESLPPREEGSGDGPSASKSWRAARLSAARRRELSVLIFDT